MNNINMVSVKLQEFYFFKKTINVSKVYVEYKLWWFNDFLVLEINLTVI